MIDHASKCPKCGAPATSRGQPSNRIVFACDSYGYMGKPDLTHQTELCSTNEELRDAWQIIQVLHSARLDDQEPWPRALEWLARNEHHRPA